MNTLSISQSGWITETPESHPQLYAPLNPKERRELGAQILGTCIDHFVSASTDNESSDRRREREQSFNDPAAVYQNWPDESQWMYPDPRQQSLHGLPKDVALFGGLSAHYLHISRGLSHSGRNILNAMNIATALDGDGGANLSVVKALSSPQEMEVLEQLINPEKIILLSLLMTNVLRIRQRELPIPILFVLPDHAKKWADKEIKFFTAQEIRTVFRFSQHDPEWAATVACSVQFVSPHLNYLGEEKTNATSHVYLFRLAPRLSPWETESWASAWERRRSIQKNPKERYDWRRAVKEILDHHTTATTWP